MQKQVSANFDFPFVSTNLHDLGQYRVKSHCSYDPLQTSEYNVFQLELLNDELRRYYQGRYLLEVWSKTGERVYQRILHEECTRWTLCNGVFIFKTASTSHLIYMIWLADRKMAAVKHPFDDFNEVSLAYYEGLLVVSQEHSFRTILLNPADITHTCNQFVNPDESTHPVTEKENSGLLSTDKIRYVFYVTQKHELIFICENDQKQLVFNKLELDLRAKKQIKLAPYHVERTSKKINKNQMKLMEGEAPSQFWYSNRNNTPTLMMMKQGGAVEIMESNKTVFIGHFPSMNAIMPHTQKLAIKNTDESIQILDINNINFKEIVLEADFYRDLSIPLAEGKSPFFQEMVVVNQTTFLLRDNIVFVYDTFDRQIQQVFFKNKIVQLMKLKTSSEDEQGYKFNQFKVVALHRNGQLSVFAPSNTVYHKDWHKTEIQSTNMFQDKETITGGFQNLNTCSYVYITTINSANEQKIYQMMYNQQIIELNLKLQKQDMIFSINATSRLREMFGIIDKKYFTIYKNDKGNLTKLYTLNLQLADFRGVTNNAVFFFQRDFILCLNKHKVYKISTRTSNIEQVYLQGAIQGNHSVFMDAQYFYFMTKDDEDHTRLGVLGTDAIEAAFAQLANLKSDSNEKIIVKYPSWKFNNIKRLDFDEFNSAINLLTSDFKLITTPLLHRNTLHFLGMAERPHYLCFRQEKELFFALDKLNYVYCWSMNTGKMLSKIKVSGADYSDYDTDREVYDKDWFRFSLIRKQLANDEMNLSSQFNVYQFKVIEIDEKGYVKERLSFQHQHHASQELHLYLNNDLNKMIELLVNKQSKSKVTLNMFQMPNQIQGKWNFVKTLDHSYDFHQKTLFPYSLDLATLEPVKRGHINNDIFKYIGGQMVRVLNQRDGVEYIINAETGALMSYIALQYNFHNNEDIFYDRRNGQFFVQEVLLRLQNYYECRRKQILLYDDLTPVTRVVDVTARNYKYKYLIEQSFTLFDLQFYQQFIFGNERNLLEIMEGMSVDQIKRFVHNTFPGNSDTILHLVGSNFEAVDYLTNVARKEAFVVPFIVNAQQLTPIDRAVQDRDHKLSNSLVRLLSRAPLDHHSRFVSHILPTLIEMNLPALEKYFDKRTFQTGVCPKIRFGKLKIPAEKDTIAKATNLLIDNEIEVKQSLFHEKSKEKSLQLDVLDIPLASNKGNVQVANEYEIKMITSISNANTEVCQQKSVRALIDYMWPAAKLEIVKCLFLPYMAFILYYTIYLVVLKRLMIKEEQDPAFYKFTAELFSTADFLFKLVLFLGCIYFLQQDLLQIRSTTNSIVWWSYANVLPLVMIIFIITLDTVDPDTNTLVRKTFFSLSSFLIWIRVIHLLKLFTESAYLLRMGSSILHKMRYLIFFIIIAVLSMGFTFYFLDTDPNFTPFDGFRFLFLVMVGNYDPAEFNNGYLAVLYIVVNFVTYFFIFTLIISLSVFALEGDHDVRGNMAYQEKTQLISLYSYLLQDKLIRDPSKKYLMLATVTERKQKNAKGEGKGIFGNKSGGDMGKAQTKIIKSFDRRINSMQTKVDKTLKDIQDRLDVMGETKSRK